MIVFAYARHGVAAAAMWSLPTLLLHSNKHGAPFKPRLAALQVWWRSSSAVAPSSFLLPTWLSWHRPTKDP